LFILTTLSAMVYVEEVKAREKWKAMPNMEVIRWSPEDEKKAREIGMKLVYDECMKTPEGQEYLEIYRTALWDLGYKEEAKSMGYKE